MDMEIARLANVSRLQMTDRHVIAIRAALFPRGGARIQPRMELRRLPILDWPPTLFQDQDACH